MLKIQGVRFSLACAVVLLLAPQVAWCKESPIHLLQQLVTLTEKDKYQLDNLFDGRQDPAYKQTVDYSRYLTPALLNAYRLEEVRLLKKECEGKYIDGMVCGIDYSPITCAQDTPENIYKIVTQTPVRVVITAQHLPYQDLVTYRLLRISGRWMLDGVNCGNGTAFNLH